VRPPTPPTVPPVTAPRQISPADTENNQQAAAAYVRQQAPDATPAKLESGYLIAVFGNLCNEIANAKTYGADAPLQLIDALYRNTGESIAWTSAVITGGILSTCPGERALLQRVI
jgi:hypothetical protein